jgi:hypothetical protein
MNKLHKPLSALLIAFSVNVMAGDCPALSGKYTIGKSKNANFASVSAAASALKCGGVSAPVTFVIEKGVYNEQVLISNIKGASDFNTVTFTSASNDNADAVITAGNGNATLVLNGVSYVSFKNISISHKTAGAGNCMRVEGKSNHLNFKGVAFYGVETTQTGAANATVNFTTDAARNAVSFSNCEVNNGSIGIAKGGAALRDTHTSISGTLFFNQYETAIALNNEESPFVGTNVISSLSTYNGYRAISFDNVTNNLVVRSNIINATSGSTGVAMNNCTATAGSMGQISDNSINIGGKSEAYGIFLSGATDNQSLAYNRVKLTVNGPHTATQAYYRNTGTGNHIEMNNNIGYGMNNTGVASEPGTINNQTL